MFVDNTETTPNLTASALPINEDLSGEHNRDAETGDKSSSSKTAAKRTQYCNEHDRQKAFVSPIIELAIDHSYCHHVNACLSLARGANISQPQPPLISTREISNGPEKKKKKKKSLVIFTANAVLVLQHQHHTPHEHQPGVSGQQSI